MKKTNILMYILLLFSICALIVVFIINQNVTFELKGEDTITLEINSRYEDDGYVAKVFKNDLSTHVKVKNNVDYSKEGTYNINYYLTYVGKIYMLSRTVNVVDTENSEVKLNND